MGLLGFGMWDLGCIGFQGCGFHRGTLNPKPLHRTAGCGACYGPFVEFQRTGVELLP